MTAEHDASQVHEAWPGMTEYRLSVLTTTLPRVRMRRN
jgi:hypothetical protein